MSQKLLFIVALAILILPFVASAATFEAADQYELISGEEVADDLYAAGGSVVISGNVTGDLYLAGGDVKVLGDVGEDAVVAGGSINIIGEVEEDLRVAGGNITIAKNVGSDLIVTGGTVLILDGVTVGEDLVAAGGRVVINGTVNGNLVAKGGEIVLNGNVKGDSEVTADQSLTINEKAVLEGTLTYSAPEEATIAEGAQVNGEVAYTKTTKRVRKNPGVGSLAGVFGFFALIKFIFIALGAILIVKFFPNASKTFAREAMSHPWGNLGRGLVIAIVAPVLIILLCISVFGLLFGVSLALLYGFILLFAGVMTGIFFGSWLWQIFSSSKQPRTDWISALVGVVALFVISLVPFVGWIFTIIVYLITLGSVIVLRFRSIQKDRQSPSEF